MSARPLYYLSDVASVTPDQLAIVRVPLSGGKPHALYHQKFNIGTQGIAVSGGHIFWDNANHIGRVNLNGSGANPKFIFGVTTPSAAPPRSMPSTTPR